MAWWSGVLLAVQLPWTVVAILWAYRLGRRDAHGLRRGLAVEMMPADTYTWLLDRLENEVLALRRSASLTSADLAEQSADHIEYLLSLLRDFGKERST